MVAPRRPGLGLGVADALRRSRGGSFKFRAQCSESLASRPTSAQPAACALAGGRPCCQNAILARGFACGGVPSLVRPEPSRHGPRHRPGRGGPPRLSRRPAGGDPEVVLLQGVGRRRVSVAAPSRRFPKHRPCDGRAHTGTAIDESEPSPTPSRSGSMGGKRRPWGPTAGQPVADALGARCCCRPKSFPSRHGAREVTSSPGQTPGPEGLSRSAVAGRQRPPRGPHGGRFVRSRGPAGG